MAAALGINCEDCHHTWLCFGGGEQYNFFVHFDINISIVSSGYAFKAYRGGKQYNFVGHFDINIFMVSS